MRRCEQCGLEIIDRFYLSSLDRVWHQDCLLCSCCRVRLAQAGDTLYVKLGLLFCSRDYMRLFGVPGQCKVCGQTIGPGQMRMKVEGSSYHLHCFNCTLCGWRFCVGDPFIAEDNKLYCLNH